MLTPRVTEVPVKPLRKRLAVDFDGVIHGYSKGWCAGKIYDEPVPGTVDALRSLHKRFELVVFTARHNLDDVRDYLAKHRILHLFSDVTNQKPMAVLYIDDRALHFVDWAATLDEVVRRTAPPS